MKMIRSPEARRRQHVCVKSASPGNSCRGALLGDILILASGASLACERVSAVSGRRQTASVICGLFIGFGERIEPW
jgi:hypothetical protein